MRLWYNRNASERAAKRRDLAGFHHRIALAAMGVAREF
jgi:hypothetical protein